MADKDNTKTCETCFHEKTHFNDPPCNTCSFNYGSGAPENWAAKPEVFWAEKAAPEKSFDAVQKPKHYQLFPEKGIEVRDLMIVLAQKMDSNGFTGIQVSDYIQAMQYFLRFMEKGGKEDLDKGVWYINKLIEAYGPPDTE